MPKPIIVMHVVDCLNVGGTERQLFELLGRLDRSRFRPLLACFKAEGELAPKLAALGITPYELPLRGTLVQTNTALQIARLARICRREQVHIVHAHDFYSNVIGMPAARLGGAAAIASRRDLAHWLSRGQRQLLRASLRLAHCVLANASAVGDQVSRLEGVPPSKLRVIPNGIDIDGFDRQARKRPNPPLPPAVPGAPRVAVVASMHLPDKGHADLLEAAALLESRRQRVQWLFVSDGALRPEIEARARALGVAHRMRFLGRRGDVPSLLHHADLVVHPSWAEGFPNVVLEAMCAGRPVLATRVGGTPEVLVDGTTGILVAPHDPRALADALERLIRDPRAAQRLGEQGRARALAHFSFERTSAATEALYVELETSHFSSVVDEAA